MFDGLILCKTSFRLIPPKKCFCFGAAVCMRQNWNSFEPNKYYYEYWRFLNNTNGYIYKFYAAHGDFTEDECCDDMFDFTYLDTPPQQNFYVSSTETPQHCAQIKLKTEYYDDFSSMIKTMLKSSPMKQVMFLCFGQLYPFPQTPVIGTITPKLFMDELAHGRIYTDICYCIEDCE